MQVNNTSRRIFDTVVYGDTCAAFGAAVRLRQQGEQVLLVSRHTGLMRETSWSFLQSAQAGVTSPWIAFRDFLQARQAWQDGRIDGGCAEVAAGEYGQKIGLHFLLYAVPFGWEEDMGLVSRVGFFTKQGEDWIAARRWIDASGAGELARLWQDRIVGPKVEAWESALFFRHRGPVETESRQWSAPAAGVTEAIYGPSLWKNETVLRYRGNSDSHGLAMLEFVRAQADLKTAVVSHGSFVPFEHRSAETASLALLPGNTCQVNDFPADVGGLFDAGVLAAETLQDKPASTGRQGTRREAPPSRRESFDVGIVGLGTGGALAALAAAREGARVAAIDLLPVLGGVGTAGGIHLYYFGVEGGLQHEIDRRVADIMPLFGSRKNIAGFHPLAKSLIVEEMLKEAGVRIFRETMLGPVQMDSASRIAAARVFTSQGPLDLEASAWVDSSGDGDLATAAGVPFERSARSDGGPSAFSQGSGRFRWRNGELFLRILNFDAGYVDATDSWDLSRARLRGLSHYQREQFTDEERPTYIAPLIGVRQSRHVRARYLITLADLATRRRFADSVGYTACHFDSHAIDFEFESDEAAFWIWGCRNWRLRTACEIPYRALLPEGVDNLLLGCRVIGATPDAHQSFRMQRDMQRVGEIAGIAAAFVSRFACDAAGVPYEWLRDRLRDTGALESDEHSDTGFGYRVEHDTFHQTGSNLSDLIENVRDGFGLPMYLLTLCRGSAIEPLRHLLNQPAASWRSAVVLAMLGDEAAAPRLVEAVREREMGFAPDDQRHPNRCPRLAPNWISALVFLRRCATPDVLEVLTNISEDDNLVHNARTAIALLCESLANRLDRDPATTGRVGQILHNLQRTQAPNAVGRPQRTVTGISEKDADDGIWYPDVVEDFRWQLDFAVSRARVAWDLELAPGIEQYLTDHRAPVRNAFASVQEKMSAPSCPEAVLL